jgi:hypothetical protein
MDPEEILTREALSKPAVYMNYEQEDQVKALSKALKEIMRKELLNIADKNQ